MTAIIHQLYPTSARTAAQRTRLRLTRRGRIVFGTLGVILASCVISFGAMLGSSGAQASVENVGSSAFTYVVAEPGDTLWAIANRVAPAADARDVIYEIKRLNQLEGSGILVGQELAIPLQYTE